MQETSARAADHLILEEALAFLCAALLRDLTAAMTLIPAVKWAQRKGCVYTTIDLQDAKGERERARRGEARGPRRDESRPRARSPLLR